MNNTINSLYNIYQTLRMASLCAISTPVISGISWAIPPAQEVSDTLRDRVTVENPCDQIAECAGDIELQTFRAFQAHAALAAALAAAGISYNPPTVAALKAEIATLNSLGYDKKGALYNKALQQFKGNTLDTELANMQITPCPNPSDFVLTKTQSPKYFQNGFVQSSTSHATSTSSFYTYIPSNPSTIQEYWVDFANRVEGGGLFQKSDFAQEEKMFSEIPALAAWLAANLDALRSGWSTLRTRLGTGSNDNRVLQGNPTPWIIEGVTRVLNVVNCYGPQFAQISMAQLMKDAKPVNQPGLNILSMAAPKLLQRSLPEQTNIDTIHDLFNTVYAGFSLAKASADKANKRCLINTGALGAGVFNNNKIVVYLAQRLAAYQLNVDIKICGYDAQEAQLGEYIFTQLIAKNPATVDDMLNELQKLAVQYILTP